MRDSSPEQTRWDTHKETNMPRPNKILEPTKAYNLNIKVQDYDKLSYIAQKESNIHGIQVSVADLMRESIEVYLDAYEESEQNA